MRATAFHDLPERLYPVLMEAFRADTGERVWFEEVTEPAAIEVPPLKLIYGVEVYSRVTTGDGEASWSDEAPIWLRKMHAKEGEEVSDEEEFVPVMMTGQAEGAIPNGTKIKKCNSEEGDAHQDGAEGTVLSSIGLPEKLRAEFPDDEFAYFISWHDMPGLPVGIRGSRIEVAE